LAIERLQACALDASINGETAPSGHLSSNQYPESVYSSLQETAFPVALDDATALRLMDMIGHREPTKKNAIYSS